MKNLFKTRLLPLLLAALLAAALTACGGAPAAAGSGSGSGSSASSAPAPMSQEDYAAEIAAMNGGFTGFVSAMQSFMTQVAANPDDLDGAVALLEDARKTAQPMTDFAAIGNPPEGFEDVHATLSEGAQLAADTIGAYCDVVIDSLKNNTEVPDEAVTEYETNMTRVSELISSGVTEVQALMSK